MFLMYVCAVKNPLLSTLCMYVFFSALLAPLKPSFQISSYTALEIINFLIGKSLYEDTNKLS